MNATSLLDRVHTTIRKLPWEPVAFAACLATSILSSPAGAAEPAAAPAAAASRVAFDTSEGRIVIEVNADKAPKTVANFLQYVNDGFYNGTVFHRVIPGFMIQGGGFTPDMTQKPTRAPVPIESTNGLKNVRGAVAMARTGDPNSATAQFFINVVDNAMLDYPRPDGNGYAVFGTVVEGMEVVDKIRAVRTASHGSFQDVPVTAVVIKTARVVK
ncbi:MAG TPA: peptidylprolyl isomerase [Burkholderiaceae bacterium]|jgi:peptidyl-prolyl cis-trans isomerase A (cyclophilin A)